MDSVVRHHAYECLSDVRDLSCLDEHLDCAELPSCAPELLVNEYFAFLHLNAVLEDLFAYKKSSKPNYKK